MEPMSQANDLEDSNATTFALHERREPKRQTMCLLTGLASPLSFLRKTSALLWNDNCSRGKFLKIKISSSPIEGRNEGSALPSIRGFDLLLAVLFD